MGRSMSCGSCLLAAAVQLVQEAAQSVDLLGEGTPSGLGDRDPGTRALSLEGLLDGHEAALLEHAEVPREIAVRELEPVAEVCEVGAGDLAEHREDPEADALVDDVREPCRRMGHRRARSRARSKKA